MLESIYHLFPATIHPMVVHFTIAINYLSLLAGFIGLFRPGDRFYARSYTYLLILAILSTIAAGVAGVISESYLVHISAGARAMLPVHRKFGELTGVALVIALAFQWLLARRKDRISLLAFLFSIVAAVLVTITGHLGGTMVYHYGLGVHTSIKG
ncbi:DUF2231 domain-containing protein [Alicyclobacillus sp. TC]|uniref:DUF2231 domain-containing protein n=1 Tax=Alicyclobacillus sp. TC TaxID=2606450 RepID=UPI0019333E08|nr:DUF2231 domain-containing protein [Alicyclobacillus sp. TC]QRF24393.1 DUF2231 domain-containing protein [Alicyclobacillus sp. TC]